MGLVREDMIVGQPRHLPRGCFNQTLLAEADRDAPQAREPLDIFAPLVVVNIDTGATVDDDRPHPFVPPQIGRGVDLMGDVFALQGIR